MQNSSVEGTNFNANHIHINGILTDFNVPKIMGVLNVTEDSFYEGGRLKSDIELIKKARQHLSEGADFLDVGGFSTRPGALVVGEDVELLRVASSIKQLKNEFPTALISVDTFRGSVAKAAIDAGATIINDISGFQFDKTLLDVISANKVTYVLMHVADSFENMHRVSSKDNIDISTYCDIVKKVSDYFLQKLTVLHEKGITDVIIDPGFGFSKTTEENYELLHRLNEFKVLNKPILVGISRKSMIYKKLGINASDALNGTTALNAIAVMKGASVLRVHDVKACKEVIDLLAK